MTQIRSIRLVGLAPAEQAPLLPAGFERIAGVDVRARTLEDFLAELDAGGILPDAVLAFDGARVAAVLRRHERCALLTIFSYGPPDAAVPPGCDAVLAEWTPEAAERVRERALLSPADPEPARDSERRTQRFARWLAARGRGDEADAAAFGVEAPHSLLEAWRAAGRIEADPAGGWRPAAPPPPPGLAPLAPPTPPPQASTSATAPVAAAPIATARWPGRYGWPALLLLLFALLVMQGEGWLGGGVDPEARRAAERRPVIGRPPPTAPAPEPARIAAPPPPAVEENAPPPVNPSHVLALASARRGEERVFAARDGVLEPMRPAGGAIAAGDLLARIADGPPPASDVPERELRAARERASVAEERYARRRALAAEGVLAWVQVAPDWQELESARAALAAAEAAAVAGASAPAPGGGTPGHELRAPRAGVALEWLAAPGAVVRAGDAVLRYATADARLELELGADEPQPALAAPFEARLGPPDAEWIPVRVVSGTPRAGGGAILQLVAPEACGSAPPPARVELRWPAR